MRSSIKPFGSCRGFSGVSCRFQTVEGSILLASSARAWKVDLSGGDLHEQCLVSLVVIVWLQKQWLDYRQDIRRVKQVVHRYHLAPDLLEELVNEVKAQLFRW